MKHIIALTISLFLLASCNNQGRQEQTSQGDTLRFEYARLLTVVKHKDYTLVRVANPWKQGETLHYYVLINRADSSKNLQLPEGTKVYVPLRRSVVFTTAHCQLLEWLGAVDRIKGVADLKYINIPDIQQRVRQGLIADCGNAMQPTLERILDMQADALLLSPFENSGGYGKLEQTDIPIIEAADYMEKTALARAEWMRFYGLLYGKEAEADSLFKVVRNNYLHLKAEALRQGRGRSMLTERITGNVWYVPGGQSTAARLIADAGGRYPFAHDNHAGSLPLSMEKVIERAGDADVWLVKYNGPQPLSRTTLLQESHSYTALKAFRTGNVYACDCLATHYFEETPFRPDYLLSDFLLIAHGNPSASLLRYYKRLAI